MRALNQETSQTVFCGPYLDDPKAFGKWYLQVSAASWRPFFPRASKARQCAVIHDVI